MAKSPRACALWALLLAACRAAPPTSAASPFVADAAPGDPLEYVPAAGLRWLLVAHPARIFADSRLKAAVESVIDPRRIDAFTSISGVDVRSLEEVVVASYDLGTLYVTSLPSADGGRARSLFEQRLSTGALVKHPRPTLYRIAGTREGEPRALVSVDDRVFAVAVGDLTLSRIAEAYAERRLKSPSALHGVSLSELPPAPSDALAMLYAPGPFTDEAWASAAGGLLRAALAVDIAVRRGNGTTLPLTITAVGDWMSDETKGRMETAWSALAANPTGRLLGLEQAKNVSSVANLHQLTWSADLDVSQLAAGLRAATAANVSEMFDVQGMTPAGSPANHRPTVGPPP